MLQRTELIKAQGIGTTYFSRTQERLDINKLSNSCYMAADAFKALQDLCQKVEESKGKLYVSDMFRSWQVQDKAYQDWKQGKRKDFAAPPGESFHMAGRAVDIDMASLGFDIPQEHWLAMLWSIAIPMGWKPIINQPDMTKSECWHFQYPGEDWSYMAKTAPDCLVAQCAILDCGQWNPDENTDKLQNLFLQAQANRARTHEDGSWLVLDGNVGPHTRQAVNALLGPSWSVTDAIERLKQL